MSLRVDGDRRSAQSDRQTDTPAPTLGSGPDGDPGWGEGAQARLSAAHSPSPLLYKVICWGRGAKGLRHTAKYINKQAFSVFVFNQAFINKKAYINYIKIVFDSRVSHHVVISSSRGDADSGADAPGGEKGRGGFFSLIEKKCRL